MSVTRHPDAIMAALREAGQRWGDQVARKVVTAAKERCPVDEGTLRSSIDSTVEVSATGVKVTVGSPLDYAAYLHEGTGVHGPRGAPITPTSKRALKFQWDGPGGNTRSPDKRGWVFAKSVKGIEPNPFLADALESVMGSITERRKK